MLTLNAKNTIINSSKRNNANHNGENKMNRMTEMHIEYLREMMNHTNEEWAAEAEKEFKEIQAEFASKGIIII